MKISEKMYAGTFYAVLTVAVIGTLAMAFMPFVGNGAMGMSMSGMNMSHMSK